VRQGISRGGRGGCSLHFINYKMPGKVRAVVSQEGQTRRARKRDLEPAIVGEKKSCRGKIALGTSFNVAPGKKRNAESR